MYRVTSAVSFCCANNNKHPVSGSANVSRSIPNVSHSIPKVSRSIHNVSLSIQKLWSAYSHNTRTRERDGQTWRLSPSKGQVGHDYCKSASSSDTLRADSPKLHCPMITITYHTYVFFLPVAPLTTRFFHRAHTIVGKKKKKSVLGERNPKRYGR